MNSMTSKLAAKMADAKSLFLFPDIRDRVDACNKMTATLLDIADRRGADYPYVLEVAKVMHDADVEVAAGPREFLFAHMTNAPASGALDIVRSKQDLHTRWEDHKAVKAALAQLVERCPSADLSAFTATRLDGTADLSFGQPDAFWAEFKPLFEDMASATRAMHEAGAGCRTYRDDEGVYKREHEFKRDPIHRSATEAMNADVFQEAWNGVRSTYDAGRVSRLVAGKTAEPLLHESCDREP